MKSSLVIATFILTFTAVLSAFSADDQRVRAGLFEVQSAYSQTQILFNEVTPQQKERVRYISQKLALAESYLQQSLNQLPPNPPHQEANVELFRSDSCSSDLVAVVNSTTDCSRFNDTESVWAIRVNNKCQDIDDTNLMMGCRAFKAMNSPRAVKLYHSDTCRDSMIAAIDHNTACESLTGLENVWAIQSNGQCQDVSDLDVVTACKRFKP